MSDLKLPTDEKELFKIFCSPVLFGEAFLLNRDGSPRRFRDYQKKDLEDIHPYIIHRDATEVGKTFNIESMVLHFLASTRGLLGLVVAELSGHFEQVLDEILVQFDHNEILKDMLRVRRGIIRSPYPQITFKNGSVVHFRPAHNDGAAYRGLHVNRIWLDEAPHITREAWGILYQRLLPVKPYPPGTTFVHPQNLVQMRAYGYPDGDTSTRYYEVSTEAEKAQRAGKPYPWKLYHWPMSIMPGWTKERDDEKALEFGGRHTPQYHHMVLGIHGTPEWNAFDLESFFACLHDVPDYEIIPLDSKTFQTELMDGTSIPVNEAEAQKIITKIFQNKHGEDSGKVWMGSDTGYVQDPAEIVLWREVYGHMTRFLRIHMEHVPYHTQTRIIAALDRIYHPRAIGIDDGGNGKGIIQDLRGRKEYSDLANMDDRLIEIKFGGVTIIEVDDEGREHKQGTKELMTMLINGAMHSKTVTMPKGDLVAEQQYTGHTYRLKMGRIIYSEKNDHIIDADRCAFLAREMILKLRDIADGMVEVVPTTIGVSLDRAFG